MHEKSQLQIYKLRIGLGLPQWSDAGSIGSVSGQRSKIPHASRYGQKKKKEIGRTKRNWQVYYQSSWYQSSFFNYQ